MTSYGCKITLGKEYRDRRTALTGYANCVIFHENGCVETELEWTEKNPNDGIEIKTKVFSDKRLDLDDAADMAYVSGVTLGQQYTDQQTGITGYASCIEFHERMATRVVVRSPGTDKDGNPVLKYHVIDDFLLSPVLADGTIGDPVERSNDEDSPITREVFAGSPTGSRLR